MKCIHKGRVHKKVCSFAIPGEGSARGVKNHPAFYIEAWELRHLRKGTSDLILDKEEENRFSQIMKDLYGIECYCMVSACTLLAPPSGALVVSQFHDPVHNLPTYLTFLILPTSQFYLPHLPTYLQKKIFFNSDQLCKVRNSCDVLKFCQEIFLCRGWQWWRRHRGHLSQVLRPTSTSLGHCGYRSHKLTSALFPNLKGTQKL